MGRARWWSDETWRGLGVAACLLAFVTTGCDAPSAEKNEGYAARAPSAPPSLKTSRSPEREAPEEDERAPSSDSISNADANANSCTKGQHEVALTTDDDVALVADFYPTGEPGAPAVILLHMIPPRHDRGDYPASFINELRERGLAVLNVNRRGAEGSGGVAKQAYKGDKGWLDVKAGRDFLVGHACATPPERIAIVGASNGTTSALDFTVRAGAAVAANDDTLTPPATLVFLSGGKYTEAQHKLNDHAALLDAIPILFVFPRKEAAWSRRAARRHRGAPWTLQEYKARVHGTELLKRAPASVTLVADHLARALTGAGERAPG